jgi:hypothetical protein
MGYHAITVNNTNILDFINGKVINVKKRGPPGAAHVFQAEGLDLESRGSLCGRVMVVMG